MKEKRLFDAADRLSSGEFFAKVGEEESATLEFKEALPPGARLQDPAVSFVNSRGGLIILGVSAHRPRKVVGLEWGESEEERIQEVCRATRPQINISTRVVTVDDLKVVILSIDPIETGWVQHSDGRTLVRAGPTNRVLFGDELRRFLMERGHERSEDREVQGVTFADLDPELLRDFFRARLGRKRITTDLEPLARDVGMLTPTGHVRLSTLLMMGRQPQRHCRRLGIDALRFEGSIDGRHTQRERVPLTGSMTQLITQADRMIYEIMRRDAVVRGLVREEVPEFPPVAIREGLVNAVAHRDYAADGQSIQLRIFDDGIEIESPGTLPGYVTVENLRESQYSRNPRIMDCLERLGFVEEAGQGIDRMFLEMENALLDPPQFEERSHSFIVRLRGRGVFSAEDRLWISGFADLQLDADSKIALVYARRHGAISNEELREARELSRAVSRAVLQNLVSLGLMEVVGQLKGTRYVVVDPGRGAANPSLNERLIAILAHARRTRVIANRDVRGLLNVDDNVARGLLEELTRRKLLTPIGERRARRYLVPRTVLAAVERWSGNGDQD